MSNILKKFTHGIAETAEQNKDNVMTKTIQKESFLEVPANEIDEHI